MSDHREMTTKPFHLLTPDEKTVLRIAQNRAIAEKVGEKAHAVPPSKSSKEYVRSTPEDHMVSVIRKVKA
jgi:hypothetical protein